MYKIKGVCVKEEKYTQPPHLQNNQKNPPRQIYKRYGR